MTVRGERRYLWRAVDQDGDVLGILVQKTKDQQAASHFFRKLTRGRKRSPQMTATDKLPSYGVARCKVMPSSLHCADFVDMFSSHFLFELFAIERFWIAAFLAFNQSGANGFDFSLTRLVTTDQVVNIFTVIGELPCGDLGFNPAVLLIGNGEIGAGVKNI